MAAFFSNLAAALPTALWVGRILLAAAAVWVLLRCGISLFGNREAPEVWGFVSLSNGARYDLTHWENMVGRMRSADVRVNFPSVSRCHAAICRDDRGQWTVYPVNHSSGVLLNGERALGAASLKAGDCIAVGGVEMYFFPSTESDEAKVARRRVEEQQRRHTSQAGTLVLVNLCQALLFLQVFLTAQAEDRLPIGVAFGGLVLLSWVLYGISAGWPRRRLRVADFLVRMCRPPARLCMNFPVPVCLKRFAAAFLVFIFGMVFSPCWNGLRRLAARAGVEKTNPLP